MGLIKQFITGGAHIVVAQPTNRLGGLVHPSEKYMGFL